MSRSVRLRAALATETGDMGGVVTKAFDAGPLNELRARARAVTSLHSIDGPGHWIKSDVDPMDLLGVFDCLWIRPGYVLRAYRFASDNGQGVVWAMPADAYFPEPDDCPRESPCRGFDGVELSEPRPPRALDDFMEAIEGDGSPWSYLCASLFAREAREMNASWHGLWWSDQTILGGDPWVELAGGDVPRDAPGPREEWDLDPAPDDWRPAVTFDGDRVSVVIHVYGAQGGQRIERQTDTYRRGSYVRLTEKWPVGSGGRGFMY